LNNTTSEAIQTLGVVIFGDVINGVDAGIIINAEIVLSELIKRQSW